MSVDERQRKLANLKCGMWSYLNSFDIGTYKGYENADYWTQSDAVIRKYVKLQVSGAVKLLNSCRESAEDGEFEACGLAGIITDLKALLRSIKNSPGQANLRGDSNYFRCGSYECDYCYADSELIAGLCVFHDNIKALNGTLKETSFLVQLFGQDAKRDNENEVVDGIAGLRISLVNDILKKIHMRECLLVAGNCWYANERD